MFARVKVPGTLKQWVSLETDLKPGQRLLVPLYEVIRGNLHSLYHGMELSNTTLVRLTRDAEVEVDDDPVADFAPWSRNRFASAATNRWCVWNFAWGRTRPSQRCSGHASSSALSISTRCKGSWTTRLCLNCSVSLSPPCETLNGRLCGQPRCRKDRALSLPPCRPPTCWYTTLMKASTPASSTSSVRQQDDPQTVSIKMTAYRIGDDTPFVKSLIRAAERGKQVACVMEIKARFDEERNLHWAAELERVGAHVTFGVSGLKTHGKTRWWCARKQGACAAMCTSEPETTT